MTAMERIKEIEAVGSLAAYEQNGEFLLKAFKVMREIASENYYDNWKYGDESKERKEAHVIVDQAFEARMAEAGK